MKRNKFMNGKIDRPRALLNGWMTGQRFYAIRSDIPYPIDIVLKDALFWDSGNVHICFLSEKTLEESIVPLYYFDMVYRSK